MDIESNNFSKPLAYFDQNILDFLNKYSKTNDIIFLKEKFQVVYSDITLQEIHKAGVNGGEHYTKNFLRLLTKLNAQYITLQSTNNQLTNTLMRSLFLPEYHYKEFLENLFFNDFIFPLTKTNLAFWGGVEDLDQLGLEQKNSLTNLINFMNEQLIYLKSLHSNDLKIQHFINDYSKKLIDLRDQKRRFDDNIDTSIDNLKIFHISKQTGHKIFRDHLKIDSNKLEKIEESNILIKIYDYIKCDNQNLKLSIDEFFNLNNNYLNPDRSFFIFEKVNIIL